MEFVTNEKLTIVGAAGMIGSNMAQTAIMMGLTPNICLYDPYAPGLEGVAEELYHCGFEGMNITFTSDIKEALTDAKYIVNSGGAARKAGMTGDISRIENNHDMFYVRTVGLYIFSEFFSDGCYHDGSYSQYLFV